MKKIKLYQYKNCQTCKKAIKFLNQQGIDFESIDIDQRSPSHQELNDALTYFEGRIKKLFNTSGQVYREMNLSENLDTYSPSEALELLSNSGMLVKRPFLWAGEEKVYAGFKEEVWTKLLEG